MNSPESSRMDRRLAIKWMLTAAASMAVLGRDSLAATRGQPGTGERIAHGYGTDPDILKSYHPGDIWPLTMTSEQRKTASALCDVIIPADDKSPAASAVGVPDFLDEWVSAPYEGHAKDREMLAEGLAWMNGESKRRYGRNFSELVYGQKTAICDDICDAAKAKDEFKKPAHFFHRFRDLSTGGYYTTKEGMKDIGYVGNVQLTKFDGPPPEVLRKLGLA